MLNYDLSPMLLLLVWQYLLPLVLVAVYAVAAVYLFRWGRLKALRLSRRTQTIWDDLLVVALGWPAIVVLVLVGLLIPVTLWPLDEPIRFVWLSAMRVALIIALITFGHQLIAGFFRVSPEDSWLRLTILRKIILFTIYAIGGIMVLTVLGVPVSPLLAALGIGSLAVALAVREILANFFAGIQLALDRPLEIGQSITLENGMSGEVLNLGWMKTYLRATDGSRVIVPNARLLAFIVRNYSMSSVGAIETVTLRIDRTSPLEQAERLALAVANEILGTEAIDTKRAPRVFYSNLGANFAELTIWLNARHFRMLPDLRSAYIKAIHKRFEANDIRLV